MKYTNILEKLLCILNLIKDSYFYIIFTIIVVLTIILLLKKKISKKTCFTLNLIALGILLIFTITTNFNTLNSTLDSIMTNLIKGIYFPSIHVYLIILIVTNITTILSLLNKKTTTSLKIIHSITLFLTNFILVLSLDIISSDKIDLFKKSSIFANTTLVILFETTVGIFIIWLLSLLISKLSTIITERITSKNVKQEKNITAPVLEITKEESTYDTEDTKENKFIPLSLFEVTNLNDFKLEISMPTNLEQKEEPIFINQKNITNNNFDLSAFIPTQKEPTPITKETSIMDSILNNNLPLEETITENTYTLETTQNEKDTYTLNDYRIFNKILKDIKEHNNSNVVSIDKNLEYRLITKYSSDTYDMFKKMLKNYSN